MKNYISATKTLENDMTVLWNSEKNNRRDKDILSYITKIFVYILTTYMLISTIALLVNIIFKYVED